MQQIYDKRAGKFEGPPGSLYIPKKENFRCSNEVVDLLNAFRKDLQQFSAGDNSKIKGSVRVRCIATEKPELKRNRYSPDQVVRAADSIDKAVSDWGWTGRDDVKHLYLVRQMIARRLGFVSLHELFDGDYASQKAKDEFETGEHFLIKPFVSCLHPLIVAFRAKDVRKLVDILRQHAPAFDPKGVNSKRTLAEMMSLALEYTTVLNEIWESGTAGSVLRYAVQTGLVKESERLRNHLGRDHRVEIYDEAKYGADRQDWLVDAFFEFPLREIQKYCEFIAENTIYSTQHGVKGEEYDKVFVVFDDIGSAWTQYNFSALLTPMTYSMTAPTGATSRQLMLSQNLAYVCFSRAVVDLRIVYFTSNAVAAAEELVKSGLFRGDQVEVSA